MSIHAYGARAGDLPLEPRNISRRAPGADDVQIDIAYFGVCHSDIHQVRSEWPGTRYPCVPGHEIVGRVSVVGANVSAFRAGDLVGIGCIVDSCKHCADCVLAASRGRSWRLLTPRIGEPVRPGSQQQFDAWWKPLVGADPR